jgi:hypothetical protein
MAINMPNKFHFFTDFNLLQAQVANQSFGPAGNNGTEDEYRVTSLHQTSAQAKAYAVCDGIICAQVDANNSNLLNIILKPMQQPPLNFVPVKYYIYKGIEKSSLINGAVIDYTSTLKVVQSIKESQDAFNISYDKANSNPDGTTQTIASANALGIQYTATAVSPETVLDTDSIDTLFYRESDYQLPIVRAGWSIGLFNTTLLGFEVILDSIYYEPTLERARYFDATGTKHTIKVPQLPSTPTQAETFEHWHDKEVILNFMDPAAFYGSMYSITIEATNSSGAKSKKSGNEIYDDLVTTFYNRNRTYIDIRNEHNHSIDYYNNYGRDIQIALDETSSLQTISYYRSEWPILIVENSEFPTGNTTIQQIVRIAFPQGATDENPNPLGYICQGFTKDLFPKQLERKYKFVSINPNTNFTDDISLAIYNKSAIGDATICTLTNIKYLKRYHEDLNIISSGVVFRKNNIYDFIFNFNILREFNNNYKINFTLNNSEHYVDLLENNANSGCYNIGFFEDTESVGVLAILKTSVEDFYYKTGNEINLASLKSNLDDIFPDYLKHKNLDNFIKEEIIEPVGSSIQYSVIYTNENQSGWVATDELPQSNELIYIDVTKQDFADMKILASTSGLLNKYPIYINLAPPQIQYDTNNKIIYEHELLLTGYELISNTISSKSVNTGINIFYYASF